MYIHLLPSLRHSLVVERFASIFEKLLDLPAMFHLLGAPLLRVKLVDTVVVGKLVEHLNRRRRKHITIGLKVSCAPTCSVLFARAPVLGRCFFVSVIHLPSICTNVDDLFIVQSGYRCPVRFSNSKDASLIKRLLITFPSARREASAR